MFKLIGTVCILSINNGQFDLCFKAGETGGEYKTLEECRDIGKQMVNLVNEDLKTRNLKVILTCLPPRYQGANYNVVISN